MSFQGRIEPGSLERVRFPGGIAAGANVRTPCGDRRIEMVRPGDMIVTRTRGLLPVRMVWKRSVTQDQIRNDPDLAPIRFRPRALGPMMPAREILVAPGHHVLVPGFRLFGEPDDASVLVQAREIAGVSDSVYVDRAQERVEYYHMVFDSHQVFTVNGMPVESFLPDAGALALLGPELREDLTRQFPQLKREPGAYPPAEYRIATGIEYLPHHV